jgi:hypothetical protein
MSATTPDLAARVVADALQEAARRSTGHRRLFLRSYLGIAPTDVFAALIAMATETVVLGAGTEVHELRAVAIEPGQLLIPYAVAAPTDRVANSGSQGFSAFLRDHFTAGAGSERRILLVLDEQPLDTVVTASEDAAALEELSWTNLCAAAERLQPVDSEAEILLPILVPDFRRRVAPSREALTAIASFTSTRWRSLAEAGASLHTLGLYVQDSAIAEDIGRRLQRGHGWRERLDAWSAPGQDLGKSLRKRARNPATVRLVLDAVGPFGIDYSQFTLDELEAEQPPSPEFMRPLIINGPDAFLKAGDDPDDRPAPRVTSWYKSGGGTLALRLAGEFRSSDSGEIRWSDGRITPITIDASSRDARAPIDGPDGWSFGTCVLERAGSALDELHIAVYLAGGTWFPIERRLLLDVDTEGFIVANDANVLAIASNGRILMPLTIDEAEHTTEYLIEMPVRTPDGEEHTIPLLFLGDDTAGGAGESAEGYDAEGDEGSDEAMDFRLSAKSVVHAVIDYAKRSDGALPDVQFSVTAEGATATLAGDIYTVTTDLADDLDGLLLERELLGQPEHWAFTLRGRGAAAQLVPDADLERLALGSIADAAVRRFTDARSAFFAAVEPIGSVHAVAAGHAHTEAMEYIEAYQELLREAPNSGRYQAEFDRLVLMDAITVPEAGEIVIAPSNPATVAFLVAFAGAARAWLGVSRTDLLDSDVDAISPMHLLPLAARDSEWYEVVTPSPFLWRRYRAIRRAGSVAAEDAQAIVSRLRFFLDVYPVYKDPEQTLGIAIHEPGDGKAVVQALRRFYRDDLAQQNAETYDLPKLDIVLVSDASVWPPAVQALLAGGERSAEDDLHKRPRADLDRLIRSRVKVAIRPSNDGFRHLTYVFRSPVEPEPVEVDMTARASSLFVGGLAPSPGRLYLPGVNRDRFWWGTFGAGATGPAGGGRAGDALADITPRLLELVGGQPNNSIREGHTKMLSASVARNFMPETYESSVWVVHLDHILGLEAFGPTDGVHERYLIDYQDSGEAGTGLSSVTATQQVEPYLDALTEALAELGPVSEPALIKLLRLLNSVSGYWGLQLLRQSREQVLERIGMITAAAVLDQLDGSFIATDAGIGLLIPLEELTRSLQRIGIDRPASRINDDYLLVHIPFGDREEELLVLRGKLVEVKYRTVGRPDLAEARQEIENTRGWLHDIFNTSGPQRLFRARDLSELLRTAYVRGSTFKLVDDLHQERLAAFEQVLGRISAGDYTLDLAYWVEGRQQIGDVISVELESESGVTRGVLPGAGEDGGLIRVGGNVLAALAAGQPIPQTQSAWEQPKFEPPAAADGRAPAPDGAERRGQPVRDANRAELAGGELREIAERQVRASEEVETLSRNLDTAVLKYGLELEPFQPALAQVGPSVIRFRSRPLGSQSLDGVERRAEDIGREIGIGEAVLVGQEPYFITIDVPRRERDVIRYGEHQQLLDTPSARGALDFLVGMAASGEVIVQDIARLPHLLVAGATGSGKSVFLRCLICSLLHTRTPDDLSILLIDPKQVDFLPFEDLPHLLGGRIIFDPAEAVAVLSETIGAELERRRPILKRARVTSALEYYEAGGRLEDLPQMVVVVDEFADLASTLGRGQRAEFMSVIQRYGQLTRAFGIYLVLATQRPSVQVVTGDIKANLTARIALKVQASQDSITILGHGGAESLRDKGDLLFEHGGRSLRLQGFLVTPDDLADEIGRWVPSS